MSRSRKNPSPSLIKDVCDALDELAPPGLAQDWDNVGLLAGDPSAPAGRVLMCIDLTAAVVEEAVRSRADVIFAYHPPIFRPISSIRRDSHGPEALVFECIRNNIAIYAGHTALDAADGGTNDVIAALCDIRQTEPLEYVDQPHVSECKVVVFVPSSDMERVSTAMFDAGAGHIGDYSHCSFRIPGQGTFFGGETTSPTVGQKGRLEHAEEVRLETWVPTKVLPRVIRAMIDAHSYEEPAFDIYPLKPRPVRGIGRVGKLPKATTLINLARKLRRSTRAEGVRIVGPRDRTVERAIIVVGAAGSLPFRIPLRMGDVIITGELRHHDALTIDRIGCTAIALGHWTSERPVLRPLADQLETRLPRVTIQLSTADREPLQSI